MSTALLNPYRIAVLVPCRNEALTIAQVVKDFQAQLPSAQVYVYDNRSTDDTANIAHRAGAIVRYETQAGKGNVIRRMFADIEADIYVLVDGDNTYEVGAVNRLIQRLINEQLDMVVGVRRSLSEDKEAYRIGHRSGNWMLTTLVKILFAAKLDDMLSGYRIFSRRFVKSFPALSEGFETETELTIHSLELKIPFVEEPVLYYSRPEGSESKLNTITDGIRVLKMALLLFKEIRPFFFFTLVFFVLFLTSVIVVFPVILTYLETHLVPRLPTAVLTTSLMLLAFLSLICGLILDSVARGRKENKRLRYLSYPSISNLDKL